MKSNPAKKRLQKRLQESVTWEDVNLWNDYCFDTNSDDYVLYDLDALSDLLYGMDPIDIFWEGVNSDHVRGADYITYAPGYFEGLSEREISTEIMSDPDFLKWKREHTQSDN